MSGWMGLDGIEYLWVGWGIEHGANKEFVKWRLQWRVDMSLKLGDYLRRQVKGRIEGCCGSQCCGSIVLEEKRFVNSNVSWIGDICTVFTVKLREYYQSLKRALWAIFNISYKIFMSLAENFGFFFLLSIHNYLLLDIVKIIFLAELLQTKD